MTMIRTELDGGDSLQSKVNDDRNPGIVTMMQDHNFMKDHLQIMEKAPNTAAPHLPSLQLGEDLGGAEAAKNRDIITAHLPKTTQ
jgi:hypothetical protein